jgi:hypothetical protein
MCEEEQINPWFGKSVVLLLYYFCNDIVSIQPISRKISVISEEWTENCLEECRCGLIWGRIMAIILKRLAKIKKSLRTASEIRIWAFRIQNKFANHSVVMLNRKQISSRKCFVCDCFKGAVNWKIKKHRWLVSMSMEKRNIILETRKATYV